MKVAIPEKFQEGLLREMIYQFLSTEEAAEFIRRMEFESYQSVLDELLLLIQSRQNLAALPTDGKVH